MSDVDLNMTMAGNAFRHGGHRSLKIDKQENGYVVKAMFPKQPKGDFDSTTKEKVFVYYTEEEVVSFVQHYLNAGKEELNEH